MTNLSDINGGSMQILTNANVAIAQGDLVELGQDGKGYTVKTSDCAAVANAGQVVAPTQVYNGGMLGAYTVGSYIAPGVSLVATDGYLYQLEPNNGSGNSSYGLNLVKYSLSGALIGTAVLDTSSSARCYGQIVQLTGGNLAVAWTEAGGGICYRAIVSLALQTVLAKTSTNQTGSSNANAPQILAISTGGFITGGLNVIGFYTAAGAISGSLITYDSTGTNSYYALVLGNLSNGNILVAYTYTATPSVRTCTYNTSGVQQIAPTTLWTSNDITLSPPLLSILPGYFALGQSDATGGGYNLAVYVFNNAFAQQGSAYRYNNVIASEWFDTALTNDGTQFWSCCSDTQTPYYFINTAITTAGVSTTYSVPNSTGVAGNSFPSCWAAGDPVTGIVTCVYGTGAQPYIAAFNGVNNGIFFTGPTAFDSATPTSGPCQANIVPAGDFTFAVSYNYYPSSTAEVRKFYVWKAYSSAIQGVALAAAATGTNASVQPQRLSGGGAAYAVSKIGGTPGKSFNHNSGASPNVVGNKGSMTPYGVNLLGIS